MLVIDNATHVKYTATHICMLYISIIIIIIVVQT